MADPDSRVKPSPSSSSSSSSERTRHECERCDFIKRELIPEMVHDRCFCEPGSREFVEFDDIDVTHLSDQRDYRNELYRATARVKFSGVARSFFLVVKLPKETQVESSPSSGPFQNEEMFYGKMTREYGANATPRCYLSDLGRYGRPVVVLEDLAARGYAQVDGKLDVDHLKLCVKALAAFHGRGLKLKALKFPVFREFYAKLFEPDNESRSHKQTSIASECPAGSQTSSWLYNTFEKRLKEAETMRKIATEINDVSTVCHGRFVRDNVLFGYENGKPCDVKVIDWETMMYRSPAFDLGPILFANLPDDGESASVVAFCRNILRIYLNAVKDEYPEIDYELLQRDIITKLPYVCVDSLDPMTIAPDDLRMMLHVLDNLDSLY